MTRKDFELIARVIKELRDFTGTNHSKVAYDFADALTTTNPLFNRKKFLKACGVAFPQR